jgi:hypothetical protein
MDNLLKVRLRAINPDLGFDRTYTIILGRDLFRQWYVTIVFGRYNIWGTSKTLALETQEEAISYIHQKLRRRLSSPKRIGCSYQLVSFDGVDNLLTSINKELLAKFAWFSK